MREYDVLKGYPKPQKPRVAGPHLRTIHNRLIASCRDREFFDGDRNNGYGGFRYDGRWLPIAKNICREYQLNDRSAVLQIDCEKGFLLNDFLHLYPGMKIRGTETSEYAIQNAMPPVRDHIRKSASTALPFEDGEFDLVIAIGSVYCLNLSDAVRCLGEIQRVGKGRSFVTLASYETGEDFWLFRYWSLLGTTILRPEEWIEVLKHAGYTGDYKFNNAKVLSLVPENSHAPR